MAYPRKLPEFTIYPSVTQTMTPPNQQSLSNTYPYRYRLYGLILASTLEFPELLVASFEDAPDFYVRHGYVPHQLVDPKVQTAVYQIRNNDWLLNLERQANMWARVHDGQFITIDPIREDDKNRDAIRLFILGWCMGALLLQRRYLTIHGNVVVHESGQTIMLAGHSGAGKSTLTAEFLNRGYQILTDDISAIDFDEQGIPFLPPGVPRLKLWQETLDVLNHNVGGLKRVRIDLDKYNYPVWSAFCDQKMPLSRIYILAPADIPNFELISLKGGEKLSQLGDQLYRLTLQQAQKNWPWVFQSCAMLANNIPIYRVKRSMHRFVFSELADQIELHVKGSIEL